jgi:hypothetical protein
VVATLNSKSSKAGTAQPPGHVHRAPVPLDAERNPDQRFSMICQS